MEALAEKRQSLKQRRLANKEDALAGDWAFQQLVGFKRKHFVKLLQPGQERYYVDTASLPEQIRALCRRHKRRCIDTDGESSLAVLWASVGPSLNKVVDVALRGLCRLAYSRSVVGSADRMLVIRHIGGTGTF